METFFREIQIQDIPDLFYVRVRTDENNLSMEELESLGITGKSVKRKLQSSFAGFLCEIAGKVVGFAMGDKSTGELWVIAVLPEYIKRGIGTKLLSLLENWLEVSGCSEIWLTTDLDTSLRAYKFYLDNGWEDDYINDDLRYMKKRLTRS